MGKLGQLQRERTRLVSRLSSDTAESHHVSDKLAELTAVTEQLHANASEEYRAHMHLGSAMFRGVSSLDMSKSVYGTKRNDSCSQDNAFL